MEDILKMLKQKEVWKNGDDLIYIAKGRDELVETFREKWEKIKMILIININKVKIKKQSKKNG